MKKKVVAVYLTEDIYEKLKKKAEEEALSMSSYIRRLIKKSLEE